MQAAKMAGLIKDDLHDQPNKLAENDLNYTQPSPQQYISSMQTQFDQAS